MIGAQGVTTQAGPRSTALKAAPRLRLHDATRIRVVWRKTEISGRSSGIMRLNTQALERMRGRVERVDVVNYRSGFDKGPALR
jgi:hypothetical protein